MTTGRKVVLLTGSSRGIGRETAALLRERGHVVYAGMRDPGGRNAGAAESMRAWGDGLHIVELDVVSERSVQAAVDRVVAEQGRLDVAVNNAGVMNVGLVEGFTPDQLRHQMDVNYLGPARVFRAAVPVMRRQGAGLFVTVSSLAGRVVFPFLGTYNPSKFAVEALAEMYRYELGRFGIDSVIVQPGPFRTGLIDAAPRPADAARLEAYGAFAGESERLMSAFKTMMADAPAFDPAVVADDVVRLVELPPRHRPLRTVSGQDFGVPRINQVAGEVQRDLLAALGLGHLDAETPAAPVGG